MLKFLNKILGGNKSEKDVKKIEPQVEKINSFFNQYQSLTNDELRGKTIEFRQRIQEHLTKLMKQLQQKKLKPIHLPESRYAKPRCFIQRSG